MTEPIQTPGYDGCDVCGAPRYRRQWCNKHYLRWRRHGDPQAGGRERPPSWFDLVAMTDHGLEWTGAFGKGKHGQYGQYHGCLVHRLAYEHFIGPIPTGMVVDHQPGCPRGCVTPEHLTLYSISDHAKVGWARGELDGGWSVR